MYRAVNLRVETEPSVSEALLGISPEASGGIRWQRLSNGTATVGPITPGAYTVTVKSQGWWGRKQFTVSGEDDLELIRMERMTRKTLGPDIIRGALRVEVWRGGEQLLWVRPKGRASVSLEVPAAGDCFLVGKGRRGLELWRMKN